MKQKSNLILYGLVFITIILCLYVYNTDEKDYQFPLFIWELFMIIGIISIIIYEYRKTKLIPITKNQKK